MIDIGSMHPIIIAMVIIMVIGLPFLIALIKSNKKLEAQWKLRHSTTGTEKPPVAPAD